MNIKLYKPHYFQSLIHKSCQDPAIFFIVCKAGRQAGKTALGQQQALKWVLEESNIELYWVSPTASQAQKVYKQILKQIGSAPIIKSNKGSQGDTEIVLQNNSIIKFRSAQQKDSLRGETIHYLIVDEAAFQDDEIFQEVLLPMLNVKGRKVLMISTPKGKNGFYKAYMKGINGDPKYASFTFTSVDSPYANQDVINLAKESMPKVLFEQEYLAHFVDNSAIFENVEELSSLIIQKKPILGDKYYIGVDIALKNDYNVVTVYNQNDKLVWYDRTNNISAPNLKLRLIKIFDFWKPEKIYIEENNQGLPIIQDLKEIHKIKNIQGFLTTSKSKPIIINNLINAFASRKIHILNDEIVKGELSMFTMFISNTGTVKYSAPHGYNDDIVMSMAIGWECLQKNKGGGVIQAFSFQD
jgi:hypothetical protein